MLIQTSLKRELLAHTLKVVTLRVFAVVFVVGVLGVATSVIRPGRAVAATNNTINFQARLETSAGAIAPDNTYNIEFKLYDAASGGNLKWTGDRLISNAQGVKVVNGYLTVNLGSVNPFPATIDWSQQLYLTMNVGSTSSCTISTDFTTDCGGDGEMSPRLQLTAVPYAFTAQNLVNNSGSFSSNLQLPAATGGTQTFRLQDQGAAGTYNICIQSSSSCGFATGSGQAILQGGNTFGATETIGTKDAQWLQLVTNNSARLSINSSGQVGIGLNPGNARVGIAGLNTQPALILQNGSSQTADILQIVASDGSTILSKFDQNGNLSVGTAQDFGAITIANSAWITGVDSSGSGAINMFQVNSNNEIQVGAALNVDGGIVLPTDAGQVTFSDLPIDSSATAGTAESYTLRVGSTNALTVYGESDGVGGVQNVRVAIGNSIQPAYTLDVVGDINTSGVYRIGGTQICASTGCTAASGSTYYIQNAPASQQTANFNIVSPAAGTIAAQIQGAANATVPVAVIKSGATPTSTGDILQLQDGSGNPLLQFNQSLGSGRAGVLTINGMQTGGGQTNAAIVLQGSAGAGLQLSTTRSSLYATIASTGGSSEGVDIEPGSAGSVVLSNQSGATVSIGASGNTAAKLQVVNGADLIGQIIKAYSSQTKNLLELQNSSGNPLSKFNANGDLQIGGTNSATSTTAFQIQNTAGVGILTADTQNNNLTVTNLLPLNAGVITATNTVFGAKISNVYTNNDQNYAMALGTDGNPRIVYIDSSANIIYKQCTDQDCTNPATKNLGTTAAPTALNNVKIQVAASDGFARLTYTDSSGNLVLSRCTDNSCSSPVTTTILSNWINTYSYDTYSMALGSDGFVRLTYIDGSSWPHYVQCTNADCSTKVDTRLTSTSGWEDYEDTNFGLAIGSDGFARIVYESDYDSLYFFQCTNASCSTSTKTEIAKRYLDYATASLSVVMGNDGYARIIYGADNGDTLPYSPYYNELFMIRCTNASCSTNQIDTVDKNTTNSYYGSTGAVLGNDGFLRIVYITSKPSGPSLLTYAVCTDADCTSVTPQYLHQSTDIAGWVNNLGIALGSDGFPRILYEDDSSGALQLVRFTADSGTTTVSGTTVGTPTNPFGQITAIGLQVQGAITIDSPYLNTPAITFSRAGTYLKSPNLTVSDSTLTFSGDSENTADGVHLSVKSGPSSSNKLDLTSGGLSIAADTTITGTMGITGDTTITGNLTGNGRALFKSTTNSTYAFQVQNAAAATLLTADTSNMRVSVGSVASYGLSTFNGFASAVSYPGQASDIAMADINGDGHPDMVTAQGSTMNVMINNGDGTFAAPVAYTAINAASVAIADFNGDGHPDVVTGNSMFNGNTEGLSVFMNNGDGTFTTKVGYTALGSNTYYVTTADVNRDGHPDILVANTPGSGADKVYVYMNNGDGTFAAAVPYSVVTFVEDIAAADLNGDGYPDVVTTHDDYAGTAPGVVSVLINNGDGTFAAASKNTVSTTNELGSVAATDVNGDGKADIIATSYNDSKVYVLINNGDGTFAAAVGYTVGQPQGVATADINGDGYTDIITSTSDASGALAVLFNNGDGTFAAAVDYPANGNFGSSLAAADVNGDGKVDIIAGSPFSDGTSVYLNSAAYGALSVKSASGSTAGLIVQGASGQVADYFRVQDASGSALFNVASSGNVGIGTNTPGAKLEVSAASNPTLRITSQATDLFHNDTVGTLGFYSNDTSTNATGQKAYIQAYCDDGPCQAVGLNFATSNSTSSTGKVHFTINGSGNVGIGTTTPSAMLQVAGAALFSGTSSATALQIQDASNNALFTADTSGDVINITQGNLKLTGFGTVGAPTLTAGSNQGGSLSGASGTTYYYKISATNGTGGSVASAETSFNGASFTSISNPAAPTVTTVASGTLPAGTYYYKLAATTPNGATVAVASSPASITTDGTTNTKLSWTTVSGAAGYNVYRSTDGTNWYVNSVSSATTSITDNGTTYTWTTSATPPSSNTAITNTNQLSISWTAVTGATSYKIYRGTSAGGENVYFTSSTNSFTDTGSAGTNGTPAATDASGNLTVSGDISTNTLHTSGTIYGAATLQLSGTTGSSYIMSALGLGTTSPQTTSALTVANGKWLSAVDSTGTGYVNMFQVNSNNEIQVGAALNVDGGITLPADAGATTLVDEPFSSGITAGTANSYTLGIGQSNALTVYGENDGNGNAQNVRVGIGNTIQPAYTLDVVGDINTSGVYRIGGTQICSSSGCTPAAGSNNYVQLQATSPGTTQIGNMSISGFGIFGAIVTPVIQATSKVQTPLLDTVNAGVLNIGATSGGQATGINLNQSTTVASGKTFTANGSGFDANGQLGVGTTAPGANLDIQSATTSGTALNVTANSLTTGSAVNISSAASNRTTGNLVNINEADTYTSNSSASATTLNVTRNLTTNVASAEGTVAFDSSASGVDSTASTTMTWSHTVGGGSNRLLLVGVSVYNNAVSSVTYAGQAMTQVDAIFPGGTVGNTYIFKLVNPPSGTASVVVTLAGATTAVGSSASYSNVNQSTPIAAFAHNSGTSGTASVSVASTVAEKVFDIASLNTNTTATAGGGQTVIENQGLGALTSSSSYKTAASGTTTMSWAYGVSTNTWGQVAVAVKGVNSGSVLSVTGSLAGLTSNCTLVSGGCTDSSSILSLNQQFSGATGAVVKIQNSGTGDMVDLLNGSGNVVTKFNSNGDLQIGGVNSAPSSTAFQVQNASGATLLSVDTINNSLTVKTSSDSTIALRVIDSGGNTIFLVDTQNKRVGVNTATPGATLSVNGGNNINPKYPDGLVGTPVSASGASGTASYTVPVGKTLYVTGIYCSLAANNYWSINSVVGGPCSAAYSSNYGTSGSLASPVLFAAGTTVTISSSLGSGTVGFSGYTVSTGVTPVTVTATSTTSTTYTVPAGKTLYVEGAFCSAGATYTWNLNSVIGGPCMSGSQTTSGSLASPTTFAAGTVVTLTAGFTSNIGFAGYLTNSNGLGGL